jgi:Flp pilus assembly pilin Flp
MSAIWRSLLRDERGFVITAELVLISTVLVLGLVAALSAVKVAIAGELGDVAGAIGSLNQSYYAHGFQGCRSRVYGSSFLDEADSSDELKADFATGAQVAPAAGGAVAVNAGCTTAPCNPPCMPPCSTPCQTPCVGCDAVLPGSIAAPCGTPCETPCGHAAGPCGVAGVAPCGAAPCGGGYGGYGPYGGGCGSTYQVIEGWSRFGQSVPPVVCPPGPGPFTGTDPFAPGVVSRQNMYLQGISYGGVCAPPVSPAHLEAAHPQAPPQHSVPLPQAPCVTSTASPCDSHLNESCANESLLPILSPDVAGVVY